MSTEVKKLKEIEYNELITLGVVESDEDLCSIFKEQIKLPFNILYRLSKTGQINDTTKELLIDIFDKVIVTKKELIEKYLRLADSGGKTLSVAEPKQLPNEYVEAVITNKIEEPIVVEKPVVSKPKKERKIPRRYGKEKILKDIETQDGKMTPLQNAMLKVNTLKNIYVNLSARGIKDMVSGTKLLSDEDCRDIVAVVNIAERKLENILKRKK